MVGRMASHSLYSLSVLVTLCCCLAQSCSKMDLHPSKLRLQQVLVQEALNSLDEMGGSVPRHCAKVRADLTTPSPNLLLLLLPLQNNDRIVLLHKTFRYLSKIYRKDMTSVTWDVTQVNRFREVVGRVREELKVCVHETGSDSIQNAQSTIHSYFGNLRNFLKQKSYSACAWEVIRTETRENLQGIISLTAKMIKGN